ncbi:MAG: Gfo/Idh/MocA family oxidoreductase, partial [Rikenellaceae bacterium]|jgi:predicted dehydrogenase|nr:Gfo/Idh/MocA family oxidoreductase [Rikenellaceae bacterium]
VGSRSQEKAQAFADQWGFARAYGSYTELFKDPAVELVYIATPHSQHYENAKEALLNDKPVLCEKAFTATAWQAEELFELSRERGVFITEAIWTRYVPLSRTINEVIESGIIGQPKILSANLGYPLSHVERNQRADLAGGTLLDLGVYPINFASMVFGPDVESVVTTCTKSATGMDEQESITLTYPGGRMAVLHSSMIAKTDRQGIVSGDKGHLIVQNINNPEKITVLGMDYETLAVYEQPQQITGFEYQVRACMEAIENGWIESPYMPHAESLRIMRLMDSLRKAWGVVYPWDR